MEKDTGETSAYAADLELAEAALEGEAAAVEEVRLMLDSPKVRAMLVKRGASGTEADEIIGDMLGDCFGGERASGGIHRLLGRYGGGGPLGGFLARIALNRLISLKRKAKVMVPVDGSGGDEENPGVVLQAEPVEGGEDAVVDLLREAVMEAFASVDQEKLVLFRMVRSYGIPQKKVGEMWGWHESKISRAMKDLMGELREKTVEGIRRRDPWLELEWDDFMGLCGESVDLFDY